MSETGLKIGLLGLGAAVFLRSDDNNIAKRSLSRLYDSSNLKVSANVAIEIGRAHV